MPQSPAKPTRSVGWRCRDSLHNRRLERDAHSALPAQFRINVSACWRITTGGMSLLWLLLLFFEPIGQQPQHFRIEQSALSMKCVRETQVMLKCMSHLAHFDKARRSGSVRVHILRDQLMIFATHDPIVLTVQNQSRNFYAGPSSSEVQILQLLIKRERSSIKMCVIFSFGPKLCQFGIRLQNLIDGFVFD